jgi:transglutaminase-like putative cysteine protease
MLYPISDEKQQVKNQTLQITGNPVLEKYTDYFGNVIGIFFLPEPHLEMTIESSIEVETIPTLQQPQTEAPEKIWELLGLMKEQFPYLDFMDIENFDSITEALDKTKELVDFSVHPLENALRFSKYIFENFEYDKTVTTVETKLQDIWKLKAGVCQDFAHILLVMLRLIGIPSRYVSGYICPEKEELRGIGATHAWVEVCIPLLGWVGLDPTNNCMVSDKHIRLAVGRNFKDCTPVKGTYKGSAEHSLSVSVVIENGATPAMGNETETPLVFTYHSKNPGSGDNSYRKYMEVQQQQ